jgi:tetratricopeptide (TPR) repeat protein
LLALLGPLGASRWSRADDPRDAARVHFEQGLGLARVRSYQTALREFTEAYRLSPHFAVLYNIGQCYDLLDEPARAIEALSRYLGDGRYLVPPERRRAVAEQIAQLAARLNAPPTNGDRRKTALSLDEVVQDAATAADAAGRAATRAAAEAHAAAMAAAAAAAAVRASTRAAGSKPKATAAAPSAVLGTRSTLRPHP